MSEPTGKPRKTRLLNKVEATGILCLLLMAWTVTVQGTEQGTYSVLPASLAGWYKPQNKRQVWLHTMFAMRRELQAVEEYAERGDLPRLQKWTGRLVGHYRRIPEMVPEWADEVEPDLAARLEQAAAAGDASGAGAAAGRLERTCRSCHREFRALAAARFRAPDFGPVIVADGNGGELGYADAMEALSRTLNSIKIASEDGLWDTAFSAHLELQTRLERLGESCGNCHRDPEPGERILGAASRLRLEQLGTAIRERDPKRTGRSLGTAAVEICARCHGTHRTLSDLRGHLFH